MEEEGKGEEWEPRKDDCKVGLNGEIKITLDAR